MGKNVSTPPSLPVPILGLAVSLGSLEPRAFNRVCVYALHFQICFSCHILPFLHFSAERAPRLEVKAGITSTSDTHTHSVRANPSQREDQLRPGPAKG